MLFLTKFFVGFGIYGVSCLILIALLPLLWILCLGRKSRLELLVQTLARATFRFVYVYLRWIRFIDARFIEHAPPADAPIIICNHISMFDIVSVLAHFPRCHTFVKRKFLFNPVLAPIIWASGHVAIDENDPEQRTRAFLKAIDLVRQGRQFVIFPEGTRSKSGRPGVFMTGVFKLALETGRDITPVVFTADQPIFNNISALRPTLGCIRFHVHIMPPIHVVKPSNCGRKEVHALRDEVQAKFFEWISADFMFPWNKASPTFEYRRTAITLETQCEARVVAKLRITKEFPQFDGHFSGFPVFPAISQIDLVMRIMSETRGRKLALKRLRKAKFLALLRPETDVTITLAIDGDGVDWELRGAETVYSKGTLFVSAPST